MELVVLIVVRRVNTLMVRAQCSRNLVTSVCSELQVEERSRCTLGLAKQQLQLVMVMTCSFGRTKAV